jgi:GNAT superfamily N-acetyltransferase
MAAVEILPFAEEHLDGAASLLAERHAAHRLIEPLLPAIDDFRAHVQVEWDAEAAGGAVAVADGEVVGYLVGRRRVDAIGPFIWTHVAGHATREPEHARDLYAVAADRWVEDGVTRHFVFLPAIRDLVEPWFRLSFGASAALAMRETGSERAPDSGVTVRLSTPADLEPVAVLDRMLTEHLQRAPSFSGLPLPEPAEFIDDWHNLWDEEEHTHFVAEQDERIVGHALLYRRSADLRVPANSIDLADCLTEPGVRGSGVGLALTAHVLAWAHENGYPTMITDWRMTNLLASRFWPRRGFRETFLRLYRSIP